MSDSTANEINRDFAEAKKLISSQSYAEAEQILLRIVSNAPTHVQAWQELGNIRYRSKAFSKAIEAFQRRYGLEPNDHVVNYSLGITLIELGRIDEARGFLKRALEIKPDFNQAKQRLDKLEVISQVQNKPPPPQPVDTSQRANYSLPEASALGTAQSNSFSKQIQQGKTDPGKLLFSGRQQFRSGCLWLMLGIIPLIYGSFIFFDTLTRPRVIVEALVIGGGVAILGVILIIGSVMAVRSNKCQIYERRVDFERGILVRSSDSLWFFEITNISYRQPLFLRMVGTAQIVLESERQKTVRLTAISSAQEMKKIWQEMRDAILAQRQDISSHSPGSRTANIQGVRDSSRPTPKWSWYSTNPYAPEPPLLFKILWWTMFLGIGSALIAGLISYMS